MLSVEDEGCGIQPEDLPRIFDLFFTGQNVRLCGESTGLGAVYGQADPEYLGHSDTGGESVVEQGSKFQIRFEQRNTG